MWHETAVRLEATDTRPEGWHYAKLWKTGGYPLGYCADHPPHSTENEARECYAKYQREHIKLDRKYSNWTGCDFPGCDNPTKKAARIEHDEYTEASLCDEHLTVEHAIEAMGLDRPAGDGWGS